MLKLVARILIYSNVIAYEVLKINILNYSDHIQGLDKEQYREKNFQSYLLNFTISHN